MIKVMWFLKRADHLTLAEFRRWWLERHAPDIAQDQAPFLRRYVIRVRSELEDALPAGRPREASPWDGMAEQWFDSLDDYNAVYARADTLAHTSRFERLVFEEHEVPLDDHRRT